MSATILNTKLHIYNRTQLIKYTMIQYTVIFCVVSLQNTIYNEKLLHLKILLLEIKFKLAFFISTFDCHRRSSITLEH